MGLLTTFKARKASAMISKGDSAGAMKLYEEAVNEGLKEMNALLAYSVLLIRAGEYQKARAPCQNPEVSHDRRKPPSADGELRFLRIQAG